MDKLFLSLPEQVSLLRKRGLHVDDQAEAEHALHSLNYYRLSGYGRQFQVAPGRGDDSFLPGTSLARLLELVHLDHRLRRLMSEALTAIEIAVRSRFAHEAGKVYGHGAFYLKQGSYKDVTPDLGQHVAKIERELLRPNLRTVARYRKGDDLSEVPVWVAIELVTFGVLAKLLWYLDDDAPAHSTADALGLQRGGFTSAVHSFAVLRNVCAHHGQLWHRKMDIMTATLPKEKKTALKHSPGSTYAGLVAMKRFMAKIEPHADWGSRMDALIAEDEEFAQGICIPAPQ